MAKLAVLLIHGYGGTPLEMQGIARVLEDKGIAAHAVCLTGHNGTEDDFTSTFFPDWRRAAEDAYDALAAQHENVMVVGFSMGGTLALHLGTARRPVAIVTLAAPVYLYSFHPFVMTDWRLPFIGILKHFKPQWTLPPCPPEILAIAPWKGHARVVFLPQAHSLVQGMASVGKHLQHITAPILLLHARKDGTVPYHNALHIAGKVSSSDVRVRIFDIQENRAGHHMIVVHQECCDMVAACVRDFAVEFM
ncbi:MAG: alpha/beta fold hydrolase [Pseudomonadota bacterium]